LYTALTDHYLLTRKARNKQTGFSFETWSVLLRYRAGTNPLRYFTGAGPTTQVLLEWTEAQPNPDLLTFKAEECSFAEHRQKLIFSELELRFS